MSDAERELFVISDLHLGGIAANSGSNDSRGFRLCTQTQALAEFIAQVAARRSPRTTELVINGDFVDFLAQPQPEGKRWRPFFDDPQVALQSLQAIARDHEQIFDNLEALLIAGHRLTIILGNHDVELSFPLLRHWLLQRLGDPHGKQLRFVVDGEAFTVGRLLIEHGNRYDGFNTTDHDGLRRLRSAQSRNQKLREQDSFQVPPGSHLVAELMNPLKEKRFAFVDLLKPEVEAVLPVLLALEPKLLGRATRLAGLKLRAKARDPAAPAMPRRLGDANANTHDALPPPNTVEKLLVDVLGDEEARTFLADLRSGDSRLGDTAAVKPSLKLVALRLALRRLERDRSFDRSIESSVQHLQAARELRARGFDCVAFGHTHLAKQVALEDGGCYLNSGTWADLMRIPKDCTHADNEIAFRAIEGFLDRLRKNDLSGLVLQMPTYLHVVIGADGRIAQASLRDFLPDHTTLV